jgi:polyferredoxin
MRPESLRRLKTARIISQILFLALFLLAYTRSLDPFAVLENPFLRFDPLVFLTNPQASLPVLAVLASLAILAVVLGRVFCGWICPLGSLIEALDLLLSPLRARNPAALLRLPARRLLARYPVSLLLLGIAAVTAFTQVPALQFLHPNVWLIRIVSLTSLGLVFLGLLALFSLFARRLWCTYLCPLGALYGIPSRLPLYRLRIAACNGCGSCDRCPTGAADYRNREILAHQCLVCFDYEANCPASGFRFFLPGRLSRTAAGTDRRPRARSFSSARRSFLKHGMQLLAGLAVGGALTWVLRRRITTLLRPPGVVDEARFLENCLRCLQCVRSCPNRIIKITGGGHGIASLYTPHLEFRPYGCDYFCQVCQQVCPNRAIPLQTLAGKQSTPIGKARIDQSACVVYEERVNCLVCEEVCPVPEKAIIYETVEERTAEGQPLREPKMIAERCIGCGICEARCPAEPVAIRVFAG